MKVITQKKMNQSDVKQPQQSIIVLNAVAPDVMKYSPPVKGSRNEESRTISFCPEFCKINSTTCWR